MKNKSTVYWAPVFFDEKTDWNMFYYDLESLHDYYKDDISKESKTNNFFYCPAFKNVAKNTFLIKNPIDSHYVFEDGVAKVKSKNFTDIRAEHAPSLKDNQLVRYGLQYIFFSEDPIIAKLTSPFFNQSPHMQYGSLVPGQIRIDKWFRVLNLEINLWQNSTELKIDKEEILAYISFESNEVDIQLKRFTMNDQLMKYAASCGSSSQWESFVPLAERYKRFVATRTNKMILSEIKKNLVDCDV
jgi:hypothetical protein